MRRWKKVFLDLGLKIIPCREDGHHYGFSIFYIFKYSVDRQDACAIGENIMTADRVLNAIWD